MVQMTKEDLHEAIGGLKTYIDDKFTAHENVEKAMIKPIIDRIDTHSTLLRGKTGDGGLVRDMNTIKTSSKWIKGMAGTGLFAGASKWVHSFFS